MWFECDLEDFDGFLTGNLSMAYDGDLFVWINLVLRIYYGLMYPNKFF
jgi:hypothetical protein